MKYRIYLLMWNYQIAKCWAKYCLSDLYYRLGVFICIMFPSHSQVDKNSSNFVTCIHM